MKNLQFTVIVSFDEDITGTDSEILETRNNILRAIVLETDGQGIAPEGDVYTESVEVIPQLLPEESKKLNLV